MDNTSAARRNTTRNAKPTVQGKTKLRFAKYSDEQFLKARASGTASSYIVLTESRVKPLKNVTLGDAVETLRM